MLYTHKQKPDILVHPNAPTALLHARVIAERRVELARQRRSKLTCGKRMRQQGHATCDKKQRKASLANPSPVRPRQRNGNQGREPAATHATRPNAYEMQSPKPRAPIPNTIQLDRTHMPLQAIIQENSKAHRRLRSQHVNKSSRS